MIPSHLHARLALSKSILIGFGPIFAVVLACCSGAFSVWSELATEADGYRLQIAKVGWIAENATRLRSEIAAARDSTGNNNSTQQPTSDDALAADLQSKVKTWLDTSALQIASIQALSPSEVNGVQFITVQAQAKGSYPKIIDLLQAYRQEQPKTLVTALDLTPDGAEQVTAAGGVAIEPTYSVQIEFSYALARSH